MLSGLRAAALAAVIALAGAPKAIFAADTAVAEPPRIGGHSA
jgi:hypothetical protein